MQLAIKDVNFNGTMLRAAQDMDDIIWVGVSWVCQGLGLKEGRIKYERKKMQEDLVLSQGTKFYPLGADSANSDVLCLKLDFLPLWLAKISITPTMKKEDPQLVENLVIYQLKAKDVLADAFLKGETVSAMQHEYIAKIEQLENKIDKMYRDMSSLANIILDMKETTARAIAVRQPVQNRNPYSAWKETMYLKMDHICECTTEFTCRADVMKWLYRYINKNYGIVWDQEAREYKQRNNFRGLPNTIDVVNDKPVIKSIFESVLTDLEYQYCHQTIGTLASDSENWMTQVIAPLINKYDDHSNAGMATYRRVYKKMEADSKIAWNNLTTRYINQYSKKPSRKDLIETRPSLKKKFKMAVKELMEE